ncbi:MAG: hypothetical protein SPL42_02675 [Bacteroidales bacterium]|nr:hypothetical protein [Bacteroidales bacterium]
MRYGKAAVSHPAADKGDVAADLVNRIPVAARTKNSEFVTFLH